MAIVRSLLSPGLSLVTDRQWRQNSSLESEIVNVGERSYGRRVSPRHNPALEAKAIAERLARSLAARGALAVALVGSHATGDATAESDLDLAVVGEGPHYRLEVHNGLLVSLGWATAEEQRRRLYDPVYLGTHVTGWREASGKDTRRCRRFSDRFSCFASRTRSPSTAASSTAVKTVSGASLLRRWGPPGGMRKRRPSESTARVSSMAATLLCSSLPSRLAR
jgi:hypothetical protein